MDRLILEVVGFTTVGGALIGLAAYDFWNDRPRGPAVALAVAGAGLMLLALGLKVHGALGTAVVTGGAVIAGIAALLSVRSTRRQG